MNGKATQIRAGFLLSIFLCYLIGIISMTHICIVEGNIMVHAHRLTKEEKQNPIDHHTKDKAALLQLQQFSDITTTGNSLAQVVVTPPRFEVVQLKPECEPFCTQYELHELARRGPPALPLV